MMTFKNYQTNTQKILGIFFWCCDQFLLISEHVHLLRWHFTVQTHDEHKGKELFIEIEFLLLAGFEEWNYNE